MAALVARAEVMRAWLKRLLVYVLLPLDREYRRQLARRLSDDFKPGVIYAPVEWHISDGVDYRQPPIVPRRIQARGKEAVEAYLMETDQRVSTRFQFDSPYRTRADMPVSMPNDDPLEEWDFETRRVVLENCHAAYHRNPLAKRAVDITRQFAVGSGFSLTCRNQDVQKVLDAFIENPDNAVKDYERSLLQDLQIDGELFIRHFEKDGEVVIAPLPPWHITEIETERGFFRRVRRYHLEYTQTATKVGDLPEIVDEWVPAEEILHIAINRHSYELRGRPDLFVALPWLRAYKEWLEDRARQNKWRNAVIWDISISGNPPAGVIAAAGARYAKPPASGSVFVHGDRETLDSKSNPVGASDAGEDGRKLLLMNAVGVGLPEYMLSDGQNANLASATAQELPALWKFIDAQQMMSEQVWTPIFRRVIEAAINAGNLLEMVPVQDADGDDIVSVEVDPDTGEKKESAPEQIEAIKAFEVAYAPLHEDDPKTVAEALTLALGADMVSEEGARNTFAPLFSLDGAVEAKRIEREKEEKRSDAAQGLSIPVPPGVGQMPPGQNGNVPPGGEGQPPPAEEGAVNEPARMARG